MTCKCKIMSLKNNDSLQLDTKSSYELKLRLSKVLASMTLSSMYCNSLDIHSNGLCMKIFKLPH